MIYKVKYLKQDTVVYKKLSDAFTKQLESIKCDRLVFNFRVETTRIESKQKFIGSFFTRRTNRGFLTFIGAMDSNDRSRIDVNLDNLRGIEEKLNENINHQTFVVDSIFELLKNESELLDFKLKQIEGNGYEIDFKLTKGLNFTNNVKKLIYIESQLTELNTRIEHLLENIKLNQAIYMNVLLRNTLRIDELLNIIDPELFFLELENHEAKLPINIGFPRHPNGNIFPEILSLITYDFEPTNTNTILMRLIVPVVKKKALESYRGIVSPGSNGQFITLVHIKDNILLTDYESEMGYIISEEEYTNCKHIQNTKICNIKKAEVNLKQSGKCLTNLFYNNITDNCENKVLRTSHDVWIATLKPNVWMYVAPHSTKLNISNNSNITTVSIIGTGTIKLTPNMWLSTNNAKISYSYDIKDEKEILVSQPAFNFTFINITQGKYYNIPILNKSDGLFSLLDKKKLFDLGVDIKHLKSERTILQNMVYAPLENPWITTSSIAIFGVIVAIFLCCFRGEISCCTRKMDFTPNNNQKTNENKIIKRLMTEIEKMRDSQKQIRKDT